MYSNGVVRSNGFSMIICTTRDPKSKDLTKDPELGVRPLHRDLSMARLRFQARDWKSDSTPGFKLMN